MPLRQQKYKKQIHGYSSYAFICKAEHNRRSCRVRQLVAKVHTTPLNEQAPNASALRSDYRYTSSPPDKINLLYVTTL